MSYLAVLDQRREGKVDLAERNMKKIEKAHGSGFTPVLDGIDNLMERLAGSYASSLEELKNKLYEC